MGRMLILASGRDPGMTNYRGDSILRAIDQEFVLFLQKTANVPDVIRNENLVELITGHEMVDDFSALLRRAERHHRESPFSAIATLDERCIESVAKLRATLQIPGLSPDESKKFRDKIVMKECLKGHNVRYPEFVSCKDSEAVSDLLGRSKRVVVKPRSGCGSRGVAFIEDASVLQEWFDNTANSDAFEAEAFIDGVLYHSNSIVRDGRAVFTAIAPYLPGMANIDFSVGTPFVTVMLEPGPFYDRLTAFSQEVITALNIENGVTHLEFWVTSDAEIVFCEIAIRPGGGGIMDMIDAQYGIHLGQALLMLECRQGDAIPRPQPRKAGRTGLIGFRSVKTGIVTTVPPLDAFADEWVQHVAMEARLGEVFTASSHCTDYTARVIFWCNDDTDCREKLSLLSSRFEQGFSLTAL